MKDLINDLSQLMKKWKEMETVEKGYRHLYLRYRDQIYADCIEELEGVISQHEGEKNVQS